MTAVLLRRRRLGLTSCREIAANMEEDVRVIRNDSPVPEADLVFRWGTTSNINSRNVVNTARAIHQVSDKRGFRVVLDDEELCPGTWLFTEQYLYDGDHEIPDSQELQTPMVVRPANHHQGRNLYVARTAGELREYARACGGGSNYYFSTLINKVAEYRVFVVQGRVACVAQKTPGNPDQVAWNVAQGGRFDNVRWDSWPLKAVKKSVQAFNLSELDFGGVDVMVDQEGEAYIIEINSAPSLTSEYRQQCMAKCFDYIVRTGKDRIPLKQEKGGYLKFIHPAVCERAHIPQ